MDREPYDITQHNIVWAEMCVAGSLSGAFSERVPGYNSRGAWTHGCAIYDPRLKRTTLLEYRERICS